MNALEALKAQRDGKSIQMRLRGSSEHWRDCSDLARMSLSSVNDLEFRELVSFPIEALAAGKRVQISTWFSFQYLAVNDVGLIMEHHGKKAPERWEPSIGELKARWAVIDEVDP